MEIKGLFIDGIQDYRNGFYAEAIEKFKEIIKVDPKSEYADDACYSIGWCYFEMMQFKQAITYFEKVIEEYPDATIALSEETGEYGKIEAKARYAKINAFLAVGDVKATEDELQKLEALKADSYMKTADGSKKSFYELAQALVENYKKS